MTTRRPWSRLRRSVFAKLTVTMLVMTAMLVATFAWIFWWVVIPTVHASSQQVAVEFARQATMNGLTLASAQELAARLNVAIRYDGPNEAWATDAADPVTIDQVIAAGHGRGPQSRLIVAGPNSGRYMFTWDFSGRMRRIERVLFTATLILMALVITTTHIVLRRMLRPVQSLGEGVARLGEGDLEIELPPAGSDEFGQLTEAFNAMVTRVREMLSMRDQLLLDVSHELRSPLTRVKLALEFLPDGDKRRLVAADLAEMENMIAGLLELERLRDGRSLKPAPANLTPLLQEVAAKYRTRGPGVAGVVAPHLLTLTFDEDTMRMVFRNLLENAVAYSLPDSRPITIGAVERGDIVEVRVTDNGPGIPAAEAQTVFEPFVRLDRSRSRRTGGYGLGLSICKRVLEAHGGSIVVEPAPGRGASFLLTLPKIA